MLEKRKKGSQREGQGQGRKACHNNSNKNDEKKHARENRCPKAYKLQDTPLYRSTAGKNRFIDIRVCIYRILSVLKIHCNRLVQKDERKKQALTLRLRDRSVFPIGSM